MRTRFVTDLSRQAGGNDTVHGVTRRLRSWQIDTAA